MKPNDSLKSLGLSMDNSLYSLHNKNERMDSTLKLPNMSPNRGGRPMSSLSAASGSRAGSRAGSRQGVRRNPILRKVVAKIAKATIKKQVPLQVYRDCAEILNKALYHDKEKVERHKRRERVLKARRLGHSTPAWEKRIIQSDSMNMLQLSTEESSTYYRKDYPPQPKLPATVKNRKTDSPI